MQFMAAKPLFLSKLVGRDDLKLIALARPTIKIISAVAFRSDEHVGKSLTLRVPVKARVLGNGAEDGSGAELVALGEANGLAGLIQIVGGGLRNESGDIGMPNAKRVGIDRKRQHMVIGE